MKEGVNMVKRLYRVRKGRVIAGVAGGVAEYLDIDPTIIRLIFVVVIFASLALGVVAYFVAAIIIPEKQDTNEAKESQRPEDGGHPEDEGHADGGRQEAETQQQAVSAGKDNKARKTAAQEGADRTRFFIGAVLLILGAFLLARQIMPWFYTRYFWPLLLIAAGGVLILREWRR